MPTPRELLPTPVMPPASRAPAAEMQRDAERMRANAAEQRATQLGGALAEAARNAQNQAHQAQNAALTISQNAANLWSVSVGARSMQAPPMQAMQAAPTQAMPETSEQPSLPDASAQAMQTTMHLAQGSGPSRHMPYQQLHNVQIMASRHFVGMPDFPALGSALEQQVWLSTQQLNASQVADLVSTSAPMTDGESWITPLGVASFPSCLSHCSKPCNPECTQSSGLTFSLSCTKCWGSLTITSARQHSQSSIRGTCA